MLPNWFIGIIDGIHTAMFSPSSFYWISNFTYCKTRGDTNESIENHQSNETDNTMVKWTKTLKRKFQEQNITQETKHWAIRIPSITRINYGANES